MSDVTQILGAIQRGEPHSAEELLPLVYNELRKLAAARLAALPPGQTLQPTALVHEAWLRLHPDENRQWDGRAHFFAAAAEAMRRILVDRARQKFSQKRGGEFSRVDLDTANLASDTNDELLLVLDEALARYAQKDPQGAELVKLRFFVGLPNREAAALLNIPERTAKRTWAYARAWLYQELQKNVQ